MADEPEKKKKGHAYGLLITAVILVASSLAAFFVFLSPGGADLPNWLYGLHSAKPAPEPPRHPMIVHWGGWTKESFDRARKEDKLLLVQFIAVWDHASRLMDETSFADPKVSKWLDENVVAVRVDADERPDLALPYLNGYPTTAMIVPSGEALSVASLAYPDAFLKWARQVNDSYRRDPQRIKALVDDVRNMADADRAERAARRGAKLEDAASGAYRRLRQDFDLKNGGLGGRAKFPVADPRSLVPSTKDEWLQKTLQGESLLQDPADGGFYRYAARPDWTEPHREKLLETQARLIATYAGEPAAAKAVQYVRSRLAGPDLGFYAAQAADDGAVDKRRWASSNAAMVEAFLSISDIDSARRLADAWLKKGVRPNGAVRHEWGGSLEGLLADQAAWARAFGALFRSTRRPAYLEAASRVELHALEHLRGEGGLVAGPASNGLPKPSLDPAGTLALASATGNEKLLGWCASNADLFDPAALYSALKPR